MNDDLYRRLVALEASVFVNRPARRSCASGLRLSTLSAALLLLLAAGATLAAVGVQVFQDGNVTGVFGPDPEIAALHLRCATPAEADKKLREHGIPVAIWHTEDRVNGRFWRTSTPPTDGLVFDVLRDPDLNVQVTIEIGDAWLDDHCRVGR